MNKYFLTLIFLSIFFQLNSQVITFDQAKEKAVLFFRSLENQKHDLKSAATVTVDSFRTFTIGSVSLLKSAQSENEPAFYIINRTDAPGFVIISGEKKIRDIIACSDQTSFCEITPEQNILFNQYVHEIAVSKLLNISSPDNSNSELQAITPLLGNIRWDQSPAPYNSFCPLDVITGRTCPTGCVATAMAQVMYYYKYPQVGTGNIGYLTHYGYLSLNFANAVYNYNAMSDQPAIGVKNDEIAKLSYHCGISIETDYGPYGSSAYEGNVPGALAKYFKYKQSTVRYLSSYTLDNWKKLIIKEISNNRPVIYGALDPLDTSNPDDKAAGHAFIVDGVNNQDQYHINWGWGGCSNGYYSLNLLNPGDCGNIYTFSDSHVMITGIEPATAFECLLSVNTDSLFYEIAGGKQNFSLSSNSTWMVSSDASWIKVSAVAGIGNQTLTVETTSNEGFLERTGVVNISGCEEELTIIVTQKGTCSLSLSSATLNFPISDGSKKIGIDATASWLVSTSAPWITVFPGLANGRDSLEITVTNNTGFSQRTGTVNIMGCNSSKILTVIQDGTCSLSLSSSGFKFTSGEGNQLVMVTTGTSWSVKNSLTWATVTPVSGEGNDTVTISVTGNISNDERTGTITVSGCNADRTIDIVQDGLCYMNLPTLSVEFSPEAEDKFFLINSNTDWKAVSETCWITVSPTVGYQSDYLGITVLPNTGQSPRSGYVIVSGCDFTKKITVIQQNNCLLDVSTSLVDFTYLPGNKSASVLSTGTWSVSTETPWITIIPKTGSKIGNFIISVSGNSSGEKRTGVVEVTGCYTAKSIKVIQDICSFSVPVDKLIYTPESGSKSLNINSTSSWTASADSKWVTVTPMYGVQSGSTTLSVDANTMGSRKAILTVSGCFASKEIEISQEGIPTPVKDVQSGQFKVYPSPTHRYVRIEFPSGSGDYTLEVFSGSGQKIMTRQHVTSGEVLDFEGFSKGLYYLNIYSSTLLTTEKIVVR